MTGPETNCSRLRKFSGTGDVIERSPALSQKRLRTHYQEPLEIGKGAPNRIWGQRKG